jgi:hypothetical protein
MSYLRLAVALQTRHLDNQPLQSMFSKLQAQVSSLYNYYTQFTAARRPPTATGAGTFTTPSGAFYVSVRAVGGNGGSSAFGGGGSILVTLVSSFGT